MAKSDAVETVAKVGGGLLLLYLAYKMLPTLTQGLGTMGSGLSSSSSANSNPFGLTLRSSNGGATFSTGGGNLASLLGLQSTQQSTAAKAPSAPLPVSTPGSGGGSNNGSMSSGGAMPIFNPATGLTDWVAAGNSNLSNNIAASPSGQDLAGYSLDNYQIASNSPEAPQLLDLSAYAQPIAVDTGANIASVSTDYALQDYSIPSVDMSQG